MRRLGFVRKTEKRGEMDCKALFLRRGKENDDDDDENDDDDDDDDEFAVLEITRESPSER